MIKRYAFIPTLFLCLFTTAQVTSVSSGNWNAGTTWSTGTVPTSSSQVVIASGHTVEISSISYAGSVTINSGGSLHLDSAVFNISGSMINNGSFTTAAGGLIVGGAAGEGITNSGTISFSGGSVIIGPSGGGNRTLLNNGTLTVFWTEMWVNGNFKSGPGSTFNFNNGHIRVDGNAAGNLSSSVAAGTHLVEFSNSTAAALNITEGLLRIIDPHAANDANTHSMYVNIPEAVQIEPSTSFWLHLGDDVSSDPGGHPHGFSMNLRAGAANLALTNVMLHIPAGVNRMLTSVHPLVIIRDVIIHPNMEFRPGVDVYLGRDLNIMGTATLEHTVHFTRHNLVTGVSTPTVFTQNVSGYIRNAATSPTASFKNLVINGDQVGLLTSYSVSDTLWLKSGTAVTTNTLTLGTSPAQTGTLIHGTGTVGGDLRRFVATTTGSYLYPVHGNKITVNLTTAPTIGGEITVGMIHEPRRLTNGLPLFEGSMLVDTAAAANSVYPGVIKVSAGTGLTGGTYDLTYEWRGYAINYDPSKLVLLYRSTDTSPWSLEGTHITTTGTPTAPLLSRTGVTVFGQFGIGRSTITTGPSTVYSAGSGDWNNAATWNTGTVPTGTSQVIIHPGDSITTSGSAQASELIITSGGILNIGGGSFSVSQSVLNGGTIYHAGATTTINGLVRSGYSNTNSGKLNFASGNFRLGPANGGNRTFLNTGTVNLSGGVLEINGNLANEMYSPFAQTSGIIVVDGNAGGDTTQSVAAGTPIVSFSHYLASPSGLNLSGGSITIVDPHASALPNSALHASLGDDLLSTGMHVIRFGDGTSTTSGGNAVGFRINNSFFIYQELKIANLIIEGTPATTNRHVTPNYHLHITGSFLINYGGEYRAMFIGNSSTAPITRVGGNFSINTGSTAIIPGKLIMGPSTATQAINNDGNLQNSLTSPTANLHTLEINNTGGGVLLGSPLSVSHALGLHAGTLDMGIHTLTLGTSPVQTGTITSSLGRIAGKFRRYISANTGSYSFPVGTTSRTRLVNINFTSPPSVGGTITTEWISSYGGVNGLPLLEGSLVVDSTSRSGYWNLMPGSGLSGGTYTGTFSPTDITGYTDISKLVLLKRNDASSPWTLHGTHVATSGGFVTPVLQRTGMTAFGDMGIGIASGNTPLPVTLLSFTAKANSTAGVQLDWQVAQQSGIDRYVIERSTNGTDFKAIGMVTANNLDQFHYSFVDGAPVKGNNYYRLRIVEAGGSRYSSIAMVTLNSKSAMHVYPVPAKDLITLERSSNDLSEAVITDMNGKVLLRVQLTQATQEINIGSLAPGMYIVRVGAQTATIIK